MNRPQIGVGLIIRKWDSILLGYREKEFGYGKLCLPGGHLEMFETTEQAARREAVEECGLHVGETKMIGFTEDFYPDENKHYITIFFTSEWQEGEPIVTEPTKISRWAWYPIDMLENITDQLWEPCIEKFKMLGWMK